MLQWFANEVVRCDDKYATSVWIGRIDEPRQRYGKVTALDHIDLEIHTGEVVGLLGPNGAGKDGCRHGVQLADPGTVRNYLSEAIGKLGAQNRIEAARIARAKGWL